MPVVTSNSVRGIIHDAARDAGLLAEEDELDSGRYAEYFRRLNDVINVSQVTGLHLWLTKEITITPIAGIYLYSINPVTGSVPSRHLDVQEFRFQYTAGSTIPLWPIAWQDWNILDKSSSGFPNSYMVDKTVNSLDVKVWPIPDTNVVASGNFIAIVKTQVTNSFNLEDNVEFPQEWRIYLRWALADDICTGQPKEIMDRCAIRAMQYREVLENFDVQNAPVRFTMRRN
jgi:hypothetical protein